MLYQAFAQQLLMQQRSYFLGDVHDFVRSIQNCYIAIPLRRAALSPRRSMIEKSMQSRTEQQTKIHTTMTLLPGLIIKSTNEI